MRVRSVVGRSIMVHVHDVVPYDILWTSGDESDPIIETVERRDEKVRFIYKDREPTEIQKKLNITPVKVSNWMNPNPTSAGNGCVFIHDLRNERVEFNEREEANA